MTDQFQELAIAVRSILAPQRQIELQVTEILRRYAPEKSFRSTEYVGALGEVYAKLRFGGVLVDDSHEHDLLDKDERRVSVKTRRGNARGWEKTSAIPSIDRPDGPEDLVFVSLHDDYTPRKIWRYEWKALVDDNRLKPHKVRGSHRSYVFFVSEDGDMEFLKFDSSRDGISDLNAALGLPLEARSNEPPHWSENRTITEAVERFGQASTEATRQRLVLDVASVQEFLYGPRSPVYEIMDALYSVRRDEGLDGYKGATRVLTAFLQLVAEHGAG